MVPSVAPGTPPNRAAWPVTAAWASDRARTTGDVAGVATAGRSSTTVTLAVTPVVTPTSAASSATSATSSAWSTPGIVRTSTQTSASAGMTFICAGSPARRTVGVRWTSPRWGWVGCRAWSIASRSASTPRKRASTGLGLRPWNGMAPWAMAPRKWTCRRSAPLETLQTSPSSGSQQMAASTPSALPVETKCLAPAIIPSSSTRAAMLIRPGNGPSSATALAANMAATRPDFMSALPRP